MLICVECGALFERAKVVFERHGMDTPPYEELFVCPYCESTDIHQSHRCNVCGDWITGSYVETVDDNRICDGCYTKHDVEDD